MGKIVVVASVIITPYPLLNGSVSSARTTEDFAKSVIGHLIHTWREGNAVDVDTKSFCNITNSFAQNSNSQVDVAWSSIRSVVALGNTRALGKLRFC